MFFDFQSGVSISAIREDHGTYEVAIIGGNDSLLSDYFYHNSGNIRIFRNVPVDVLQVLTVKHSLFSGRDTCSYWNGLGMVTAKFPVYRAAALWLEGKVDVNAGNVLG